jgi:putative transposase
VEAGTEYVTRAVVFHVDPSPAQERLLRSYCGAARFSYNWVIGEATGNLTARAGECEAGVDAESMTPSMSWKPYPLRKQFNAVKSKVAPWSGEVAKHCFDTGVTQAAAALENWRTSKSGTRKGKRVGFPSFKSRHTAKLSVSFVELNHQLSWFNDSRHAVRLMLPQALIQSKDPHTRRGAKQLVWLHTVESTRRLYRLVEDGKATIQKVTISYTGGRWQASFQVRYQLAERPVKRPRARTGAAVGVDVGLTHLATLSQPVPGVTDEHGHVANPRPLAAQLERLKTLDRRLARCQKHSNNRTKLMQRRARLHGRIAATRTMAHHQLANELAARFDLVGIEDLNVAGMTHNRPLARALADTGLGQLRTIITTECTDRATEMVTVGRFYPSSKTCSGCGAVKAKLPLIIRTFDCGVCGMSLDRDVNAARNIEREAVRLHETQQQQKEQAVNVAGLRPETRNADPRPHRTTPRQGGGGSGCLKAEPSSCIDHEVWRQCSDLDGTPATVTGTTADARWDFPPFISSCCRT